MMCEVNFKLFMNINMYHVNDTLNTTWNGNKTEITC